VVKQNEAKETQPTSKTDRRKEAKQKEPKTIEISAEFETKVILCAEVGRRFNLFTRNILKNGAQETDTNKVRQAEPTYPYPEHYEDENIVAKLEEEREWIRRNLRSIDDDFLDNF
jgi:FtsZ-interacting cell division protein YlmF